MNEILDSHEKFPTHEKLSCKKDFFVLFEYMEENPIGILFKNYFFTYLSVLSNLGMNSKLYRYIYDERV